MAGHIAADTLERYMRGTITNKTELATLEKHLLVCAWCIQRAEKTEHCVTAVRVELPSPWTQHKT